MKRTRFLASLLCLINAATENCNILCNISIICCTDVVFRMFQCYLREFLSKVKCTAFYEHCIVAAFVARRSCM